MARPIRLCGGGDGTFFGRLSSAINDFRSNDGGNPVMRAASGTRTRCGVARAGTTACADGSSVLRIGTAWAMKPGAVCACEPVPRTMTALLLLLGNNVSTQYPAAQIGF